MSCIPNFLQAITLATKPPTTWGMNLSFFGIIFLKQSIASSNERFVVFCRLLATLLYIFRILWQVL